MKFRDLQGSFTAGERTLRWTKDDLHDRYLYAQERGTKRKLNRAYIFESGTVTGSFFRAAVWEHSPVPVLGSTDAWGMTVDFPEGTTKQQAMAAVENMLRLGMDTGD